MTICDKFRILFFGSDIFSIKSLQPILEKQPYKTIEIVTKPGTKLDSWARNVKLKRYYWTEGLKDYRPNIQPTIGLVASFGNMIDPTTVNIFKYGLFNVHPSLLPRYRGSTPIQHAILNGDTLTGVSIIKIPPIEKFDIGDIVLQETIGIEPREYASELMKRLGLFGGQMLVDLLNDYNKCIKNTKHQSSEGMCYAKKLKPEMGLLNFKEDTWLKIDRKVRAFTSFIDLYFFWLGRQVKVADFLNPNDIDNSALDNYFLFNSSYKVESLLRPGTIVHSKKTKAIAIKCSDGLWLAFRRVKIESKPFMSASEFYNGYLSKCTNDKLITDS